MTGPSFAGAPATPEQLTDRDGRRVVLEDITDDNWRAVADIAPADGQRRFVAALGARYLLLSLRGGVWTSLAVRAGEEVAGHVMWAYDEEDGTHWVGGMLVDASQQGRGVGRAALRALVHRLSASPACREIRLSYHPDNTMAAGLYESLGFTPTGAYEDEELVASLHVTAARPAT
ncbi:GNAT family N-acetyltransferase [Streptomyces sp. MUM 203J]|uniref:GNAT family N-acetyltransferase n=1 Tax=Streptomyces sp. MUM 203J TaxID=2791990 RepID=UPI001F03EFBB|nr:GNAT family N-acetyltransferase [Streptomyces sp. MUM 203J]MCH0543342.1 GNAT family N-acetyltransferase [Streptomyces sp. MUM 203J]